MEILTAAALAEKVADAYNSHNYRFARELVKAYAFSGLVRFEAADHVNGGTAQIIIDGVRVGQASSLMVGLDYAFAKAIYRAK